MHCCCRPRDGGRVRGLQSEPSSAPAAVPRVAGIQRGSPHALRFLLGWSEEGLLSPRQGQQIQTLSLAELSRLREPDLHELTAPGSVLLAGQRPQAQFAPCGEESIPMWNTLSAQRDP
ncbi:hypothetical protein H920_05462 [Fukomys damarensis]|uniref:Uncharacterized protein n=1 Tax=Fukomys damarensis TaxID=885580 RepID=A0A091DMC4_FUKDA|nr:hypothetical protein H920_05462 [Fukomys damarensis]